MSMSFLTPLGALVALAAVVPLAALLATERRAAAARRALSLAPARVRPLVPVIVALVLLPVLLGVAAAQPVVVQRRHLAERGDAQAFFVFDTSLSMSARAAPHGPTRLALAKREALRLLPGLGDVPVGVANMTDRTLPALMPTTDAALFARTLRQSVGIDRPPPSQRYRERATTFMALVPLALGHFYPPGVTHRILVVFTDGEALPLPRYSSLTLPQEMTVRPLLVHIWSPQDRMYVRGRVDRAYRPDPTSVLDMQQFATLTHGRVFDEHDTSRLAAAIRAEAGHASAQTMVTGYARVALAPWFVLGGVIPLGFLLFRRNL